MARNSNNDGNGAWIEVHDQSATLAQWRAEHRRVRLARLAKHPAVIVALAWLMGLAIGVNITVFLK